MALEHHTLCVGCTSPSPVLPGQKDCCILMSHSWLPTPDFRVGSANEMYICTCWQLVLLRDAGETFEMAFEHYHPGMSRPAYAVSPYNQMCRWQTHSRCQTITHGKWGIHICCLGLHFFTPIPLNLLNSLAGSVLMRGFRAMDGIHLLCVLLFCLVLTHM